MKIKFTLFLSVFLITFSLFSIVSAQNTENKQTSKLENTMKNIAGKKWGLAHYVEIYIDESDTLFSVRDCEKEFLELKEDKSYNFSAFDRTEKGSNLLGQYHKGFSSQYENVDGCPIEFLLWFHRVPWNKKLKTGRTLWEEMIYRYDLGVKDVESMHKDWNKLASEVDKELFNSVNNHLTIQVKEAKWWRNACLAYFQHAGELEYPVGVQKPEKSFQYYKSLRFPFSPGIRPRW
jgi:hypothetical protein